jgi:uncharacterized membrane protein YjfL (UPF0719 family)
MMADITTVIGGLVVALAQVVVGLALSMAAVYLGIRMFDKLTKGTDEMKEIGKGNAAIAILMAAVILSIATVVKAGVLSLVLSINPSIGMNAMIVAFLVGLFNIAVSVIASIVAIYLAVRIFDKITVELNFMKEIQKGNVAAAIVVGGVLWAISFVIGATVEGVTRFLDAQTLGSVLGMGL